MARRGRGRSMKGGSDCTTCSMPTGQTGGKMSGLNPVSLSGDSFDKSGNSLANKAHDVYIQKSVQLASLKGQNAMMGGRRKKRSAKGARTRQRKKCKKIFTQVQV